MKQKLKLLALLIVVLCTPKLLIGQLFMQNPAPASVRGLGHSNLTASIGESGLLNTAALGDKAGTGVMASSTLPYGFTDWRSGSFFAWHSVKNGQTGFGFSGNFSGIEAYQEQQFGFHAGKKLMRNFWLGTGIYWMRSSAPEYDSRSALTFSVNALTEIRKKVRISLRIWNPIHAKATDVETSPLLQTGISYSISQKIQLFSAVSKDFERPLQGSMGIQYQPIEKVTLRFGYQTQPAQPALGIGFQPKSGLRIDASTEWHPTLGLSPSLGIVWQKGRGKGV